MQYGNNGPIYPQNPTNTNNLWFGDNYSSGYSQANRNQMSNQPMNSYPISQRGPQPVPNMQQMPQTMNNIIQVMGPESAVNFSVGPNSHIMMADSNRPVIYDKKSDDSGYAETKAFALTEIPLFEDNTQFQNPKPQQDNSEIEVLKQEIEMLKQEIVDLKKLIED